MLDSEQLGWINRRLRNVDPTDGWKGRCFKIAILHKCSKWLIKYHHVSCLKSRMTDSIIPIPHQSHIRHGYISWKQKSPVCAMEFLNLLTSCYMSAICSTAYMSLKKVMRCLMVVGQFSYRRQCHLTNCNCAVCCFSKIRLAKMPVHCNGIKLKFNRPL